MHSCGFPVSHNSFTWLPQVIHICDWSIVSWFLCVPSRIHVDSLRLLIHWFDYLHLLVRMDTNPVYHDSFTCVLHIWTRHGTPDYDWLIRSYVFTRMNALWYRCVLHTWMSYGTLDYDWLIPSTHLNPPCFVRASSLHKKELATGQPCGVECKPQNLNSKTMQPKPYA